MISLAQLNIMFEVIDNRIAACMDAKVNFPAADICPYIVNIWRGAYLYFKLHFLFACPFFLVFFFLQNEFRILIKIQYCVFACCSQFKDERERDWG